MTELQQDFQNARFRTIHTKQFKAYQAQHPKSRITSLKEFASNIVEFPNHYLPHSVKRAHTFLKKKQLPGDEKGGKLSAPELQQLVQSSYRPENADLHDFEIDHELSGDKAKVYKRKSSNQAVVVHRGTQGLSDALLDLQYVLGRDISKSDRFKHAEEIQDKAEAKYGKENTSTVGHSLGSKIASTVGDNSHEIINVNKAIAPQDVFIPISAKETNVRTQYDPVSALLMLKGHKNTFTIPSVSLNPLAEHSSDALHRVDSTQQFGSGYGGGAEIAKLKINELKSLRNCRIGGSSN